MQRTEMGVTFNIKDFNTDGAGPRFDVAPYPSNLRGLIVQVFLDKVPGNTPAARRAAIQAMLKVWAARGGIGWAPHSFTTVETADDAAAYVAMGQAAGLQTLLAFGLNESDPEGKGTRIAALAKTPGVAGVIQDQESAWEGHPEAIDAADAVSMANELTKIAPALVIIDQPWPVVQSHREFPEVAISRGVSAHAPQFYTNPYAPAYGSKRLRTMMPRFEDNWHAMDRDILTPSGVGGLPLLSTIESQGHSDEAYDYTAYIVANETMIFWSEWQPDATCLHAMQVRQNIAQAISLYIDDAWAGSTAVARWQDHVNKTASPANQLKVDGLWGPKCELAMFGSPMSRLLSTIRSGLGL